MHENGRILSFQELKDRINTRVSILDFYGCIGSVKSALRKRNVAIEDTSSAIVTKAYSIIRRASKGAKTFYDILIGDPPVPNACKNWERVLETDIEWSKVFNFTKKISEIKLKWFQMKINYRVLVTNSVLKDMAVITNNLCNFCKTERNTIVHYLWQCEHAQAFWSDFENYLRNKCGNCVRLRLSPAIVLFGHDNKIKTDAGFDYILLVAKFYVYKCRIANIRPRIQVFLQELDVHKVDQYIHLITMRSDNYAKKWASYLELLQGNTVI